MKKVHILFRCSFYNLKSLIELDLQRNNLKYLPESTGNLKSLENLYLEKNQFISIS